jgi:hypothetical protein
MIIIVKDQEVMEKRVMLSISPMSHLKKMKHFILRSLQDQIRCLVQLSKRTKNSYFLMPSHIEISMKV